MIDWSHYHNQTGLNDKVETDLKMLCHISRDFDQISEKTIRGMPR